MNDAQRTKLERYKTIQDKLTIRRQQLQTYSMDSNANFQFEEITNVYFNDHNDSILVILDGRDDIEFPLFVINYKDYLTLSNFLATHIERLSKK